MIAETSADPEPRYPQRGCSSGLIPNAVLATNSCVKNELAGGFGIFKVAGLERLFRDVRLGRIHPANSFLTHEFVAKTALEINPDEQPRWG